MADRTEITFKGLDTLQRLLQSVGEKMLTQAGDALRVEAEIEMTEAKKRTPVLTGALRASGHVEGPRQGTSSLSGYSNGQGTFTAGAERGDLSVRLVFGGPAAAYAVYVHEDLEAFHRVGQAKYLESVLMESAPYLAARVAARIARS